MHLLTCHRFREPFLFVHCAGCCCFSQHVSALNLLVSKHVRCEAGCSIGIVALRDADSDGQVWCMLTKGERLLSGLTPDAVVSDADNLLWRIKVLTAGALFGAAEPHALIYHPARGYKWVAAQSLTYECDWVESDLRASEERFAVTANPSPQILPAKEIAKRCLDMKECILKMSSCPVPGLQHSTLSTAESGFGSPSPRALPPPSPSRRPLSSCPPPPPFLRVRPTPRAAASEPLHFGSGGLTPRTSWPSAAPPPAKPSPLGGAFAAAPDDEATPRKFRTDTDVASSDAARSDTGVAGLEGARSDTGVAGLEGGRGGTEPGGKRSLRKRPADGLSIDNPKLSASPRPGSVRKGASRAGKGGAGLGKMANGEQLSDGTDEATAPSQQRKDDLNVVPTAGLSGHGSKPEECVDVTRVVTTSAELCGDDTRTEESVSATSGTVTQAEGGGDKSVDDGGGGDGGEGAGPKGAAEEGTMRAPEKPNTDASATWKQHAGGFSGQHAFKAAMSSAVSLLVSKTQPRGQDAPRWMGLLKPLVGGGKPTNPALLKAGWAEVDQASWSAPSAAGGVSFGGQVPPSWLPLLAEVVDEHHGLGHHQVLQVKAWVIASKSALQDRERLLQEAEKAKTAQASAEAAAVAAEDAAKKEKRKLADALQTQKDALQSQKDEFGSVNAQLKAAKSETTAARRELVATKREASKEMERAGAEKAAETERADEESAKAAKARQQLELLSQQLSLDQVPQHLCQQPPQGQPLQQLSQQLSPDQALQGPPLQPGFQRQHHHQPSHLPQHPFQRPFQQPPEQPPQRPPHQLPLPHQPPHQPPHQSFQQPLHQPYQQPLHQPFQQPPEQAFQQPPHQPHQPFQHPLHQPFQHPPQQPFQQPSQQLFQQPSQQPFQQPPQVFQQIPSQPSQLPPSQLRPLQQAFPQQSLHVPALPPQQSYSYSDVMVAHQLAVQAQERRENERRQRQLAEEQAAEARVREAGSLSFFASIPPPGFPHPPFG